MPAATSPLRLWNNGVKPNIQRVQDNIKAIRDRIANAASRSGRKSEEITLVAVTKTVGPELVEALRALGIEDIGENRVQDAAEKKHSNHAFGKMRWHMIGHLQRNKVREALKIFDLFHSVDSLNLAREINKRATAKISVLLEVNISGEVSKNGFVPQQLSREIEEIISLENLQIQGLMTMAPLEAPMVECQKYFHNLHLLAIQLTEQYSILRLPHLSMGMSRDFEYAICEGATMVRIGSALFERAL